MSSTPTIPTIASRAATSRLACVAIGLVLPLATLGARPATVPAPATTPTARPTASQLLPWLDNLDDAYKLALRQNQNVLIYAAADWSPPCQAMKKHLALPQVQEQLKGWTRLYLDADKSPDAFKRLGHQLRPRPAHPTTPPASPSPGATACSALKCSSRFWKPTRRSRPPPSAMSSTATHLPMRPRSRKLLDALQKPNIPLREAATRRLLPHPQIAAVSIVDLFAAGSLKARLAALELLAAWDAPVDQVDPWRPETITAPRLEALKTWATQLARTSATRPATLPSLASIDVKQELAALLSARTDLEASAIRERLARSGPALLSEVYAALKSVSADRDRERLTALRYRLVSTDRLALSWPDGLDRLASTDPARRHLAVEELGKFAKPEDAPLLLELFSNPDPMIREISLRLLQSIGGSTTAALTRLLEDPEPNVRAAVLKQLAEKPSPQMVDPVVKYIEAEKDLDLIVHGIRVLRVSKGKAAGDCLQRLLSHASWRIRAEAAEALGEMAGSGSTPERKTEIYAAMIKLLEDPDGFVASRAILSLQKSDLAMAVKPMIEATQRHPDLTADVVAAVTQSNGMRAAAAPYLRQLSTHQSPAVRAAALVGLYESNPDGGTDDLIKALKDPAAQVRIAAAKTLIESLRNLLPRDGYVMRNSLLSRFTGGGEQRVKVDPAQWLSDFRAGRGRPAWLTKALDSLKPMLAAESMEERAAAALLLVAGGQETEALPVLLDAAKAKPQFRELAAGALPWLPWEQRLTMFNALLAMPLGEDEQRALADAMVQLPDPRAAEPLWGLLERKDVSLRAAGSAMSALRQLYVGERYYDSNSVPKSSLQQLVTVARAKAAAGPEMRRLVAMLLLLTASPEDARQIAVQIQAEPTSSEWLRLDCFQVRLLAGPKADAEQAASAALAGSDPPLRKVALPYLVSGSDRLQQFRGELYVDLPGELRISYSSDPRTQTIVAPKGLKLELLQPLLNDADPELAADAGYLLALLGDRGGMDRLLKYWREQAQKDSRWMQLVSRAIVAVNDDGYTPVLEEIYRNYGREDNYGLRQFYWTIRAMQGPAVLKLRKQIRDEVGMERLQ